MSELSGNTHPSIGETVRKALSSFAKPLISSFCAAWLIALPLQAAETTDADQPQALQEVIVTGSRIPVPANITATSPITAVSTQDIKLQGQTDTIEILNALPQNVIAAGADLGNNSNPLSAAGGVSTADLRGLGPQRTLVLVDGKRLGNGDPNTLNPNPAPDLDQIPAAMIERVDVVTGGASATYGSDAMAGVVNFIMKKNFEGIEVDGQYGTFMHDNDNTGVRTINDAEQTATGSPLFATPTGNTTMGARRDLSVLMGTNFADGQGNITTYFTYHNQADVPYSKLDYAACELVNTGAGFGCVGSSNSNLFQVGDNKYSVVGNQFIPFPVNGSSPPSSFNSNVYEYIQRQDVRYNAGFQSHLDLNDYIKPYLDASFMNDRTTVVSGPSALFRGSYPFSPDSLYRVNCTNPLLSAQQQSILCSPTQIAADTAVPGSTAGQAALDIGRRNIEGGGRLGTYEHTNFRIVLGSTGDLFDGISYDAYGQYYYTTLFQSNNNYLNLANIGQALIATGTAAAPTCVNPIGGCVPYNLFTQGAVTPAQLAYLQTPGTNYGTNSEGIAHIDFTADLAKYGLTLPTAHEGLGLNLGYEHRYETLDVAPDSVELANELSGFVGAVPVDAAYSANEAFIELRAPLIQDKPFVHDLVADAGYRWSNYSTAGSTETYKFELQWAPSEDARFRGSYDRAVRAPNLNELFVPQAYSQGTGISTDLCSGATPAATLAQCEHTGVTPAQYGHITDCINGQCGQVTGGNPGLKPEVAETWSAGVTFTPTMVPGLTGSVDYYHIDIFDQIGVLPFGATYQNCLTAGTALDCAQIVRNPVTGSLFGATVAGGGYVLQTNVNTGTLVSSGIDTQWNYRFPTSGWGVFSAAFNGTWTEHVTLVPYPGSISYDCAGLYGPNCQTNSVIPRWRHTMRVNWETPWQKLLVSVNWRFIGAVGLDTNSPNPFLNNGAYNQLDARLPNYSYFDLSAIMPVYKGIEVRLGVNNVLDKAPPIIDGTITGTGSPNTYPTYDLMGRELFAAFTAKF
jgi:iron complex outermembrane receptor protein